MPISRDLVVAGFKFILGRDPDKATHSGAKEYIQKISEQINNEYELADLFFNSKEFLSSDRFKALIGANNVSLPENSSTKSINYHSHNGSLYIAPKNLKRANDNLKNILVIGSCLSEALNLRIERWINSERLSSKLDHILVNNVSSLPLKTNEELEGYSFQIIQPPLRGALSEGKYLRRNFRDESAMRELSDHALLVVETFLQNYLGYNEQSGLTTFVTGYIVPQRNPLGRMMPAHSVSNLQHIIRMLNERLEEICASRQNVHYVDLDEIAGIIGKRHIIDDAIHVMSHGALAGNFDYQHDRSRIHPPQPFTSHHEIKNTEFLGAVWLDILARFQTLIGHDQVKIVIVDLDDTLWRGVLAEDGIHRVGLEGWPLGIVEALQFLKKRGILLAIASKNDETFIRGKWEEVFRGKLLLEDFASVKINWNPKSQSIREILEEVNLLPGNTLFIDDNPVERETVQREFPEIRVLGEDLYYLRRILLWSAELQVPFITEESARRTEMIQAQAVRAESRKTMSREEFLASLELQMEGEIITTPEHPDYERALELLNKTNQFNTTGKRWTPEEIGRFFAEGGIFHAFKVTDKFTAYGLVGLLLVQGNCIRQFVMSCRVVGLDVEQQMLREVIEQIDASEVIAEYTKTEQNHLCNDLFPKSGFELRELAWRMRMTS